MKIIAWGISLGILICTTSVKADLSQQPDCFYTGTGKFYLINETTQEYVEDSAQGFRLSATRIPMGNGVYMVVERKDFNNSNLPPQDTTFFVGSNIGPYGPFYSTFDTNGDGTPDGTFSANGTCTRKGHCAGQMSYSSSETNFAGLMNTEIDSKSIRTVTFTLKSDVLPIGSFVDEILISPNECVF